MKDAVARFLAAFIDVFDRISAVVTLAIPPLAIWAARRASTGINSGEAPQPLLTYTLVFICLFIAWWLLLQVLNLLIRLLQFLSSGSSDPVDLVYDANRKSAGIQRLQDEGLSAKRIHSQVALEVQDHREFSRKFSVIFLGLLYFVGLVIAAILT